MNLRARLRRTPPTPCPSCGSTDLLWEDEGVYGGGELLWWCADCLHQWHAGDHAPPAPPEQPSLPSQSPTPTRTSIPAPTPVPDATVAPPVGPDPRLPALPMPDIPRPDPSGSDFSGSDSSGSDSASFDHPVSPVAPHAASWEPEFPVRAEQPPAGDVAYPPQLTHPAQPMQPPAGVGTDISSGTGTGTGMGTGVGTVAERLMHAAGLIPLVPCPGAYEPWPCRCAHCGRDVAPTYRQIREGAPGCVCRPRRRRKARDR